MWPIRLASLIGHLFLLLTSSSVCLNYVDLAATLMIFRFVTLADIKLHPPSSKMRSAFNQAMTHLIFVGKVGKLGSGEVSTNLYCGYSIVKSYTKYDIRCHMVFYVTMVVLGMTSLMNK